MQRRAVSLRQLSFLNSYPCQNIAVTFGKEKLESCGYSTVKKVLMFDDMFSRFNTIPACDLASCDNIVCTIHSIAR